MALDEAPRIGLNYFLGAAMLVGCIASLAGKDKGDQGRIDVARLIAVTMFLTATLLALAIAAIVGNLSDAALSSYGLCLATFLLGLIEPRLGDYRILTNKYVSLIMFSAALVTLAFLSLQTLELIGVYSFNVVVDDKPVLSYQYIGFFIVFSLLVLMAPWHWSRFLGIPILLLGGARGMFVSYALAVVRNLSRLQLLVLSICGFTLFALVSDSELEQIRIYHLFGESFLERGMFITRPLEPLQLLVGVPRYDIVLFSLPGSYLHNILDYWLAFGMASFAALVCCIGLLTARARMWSLRYRLFVWTALIYQLFFGGATFFITWYLIAKLVNERGLADRALGGASIG